MTWEHKTRALRAQGRRVRPPLPTVPDRRTWPASCASCFSVPGMDMVRQVIVFDAADLRAESAFWAGILGGHVFEDDDWHSVIDAARQWRIGVQLAPNHVPPEWPHGTQQQQVHLDLHVEDQRAAHDQAIALGARLLQPAPDFDAPEGHQVYADPAGHPFCVGWGHPSRERLAAFVADRLGQEKPGH